MNSQLKFRTWDKKKGEWIPRKMHNNLFGIPLLGEVEIIGDLVKFSLDYFKDLIVMQSTGLKDKLGNEVYEGDILEFKNELGLHKKHIVFRVEGGLVINTHNADFGQETSFYDACACMQTSQWIKQCTVIGNIYKNLDLLQKK